MTARSARPDGGRGFLGLISQRGGQAAADAAHPGTTRLWLVRHAPVDHGGRIYGQADFSCDCSETALFTGLAEKLPRAAVWVTSKLRRTHETAAAIIRAGLPGPQSIPGPDAIEMADLAEQDFGQWQGLTYEELEESRAGDFHRFWHAPAHEAAPGGESFVAVIERVSRAIHRLVEAHPEAYAKICAVRPDMPVVFTTGYSAEEISGAATKKRPAVLQKPYGRKSLGQIIRMVLDQQQ